MSFEDTQAILKILSHDETYVPITTEHMCSARNPGGYPKLGQASWSHNCSVRQMNTQNFALRQGCPGPREAHQVI